ncbi:hypothetical protein TNCV_3705241 [Trichonephila clavipes]|nr:hypothetical protein TNCV_3705241 [Trichonephila clavipes]
MPRFVSNLRRRVGHPTSLNELEARVQQIWNEMSQDIIQNLYAPMLDCIAPCIRTRGVQHDLDGRALTTPALAEANGSRSRWNPSKKIGAAVAQWSRYQIISGMS